MRIVSSSYSRTAGQQDPRAWLSHIRFYTGVLSKLAKKHDVHSVERIDWKGYLQENGVHFHFIDTRRSLRYMPIAIHSQIKQLGADVVLVNGMNFPVQVMQLKKILPPAARIFVIHRAERPGGKLRKLLQQRADRLIDGYIFSSTELAHEWNRSHIIRDQRKVHELMLMSSDFTITGRQEARERTGVTGERIFLWVGRLNANKDPLTVVKAFKEYAAIKKGCKLYMIYQSEELLQEVRDVVGKDNSIVLVGKVEHEKLGDWYNSADFILSGSHRESAGIAIVEGMSCGCIPIVTNIPSFRKMTKNGSCGRLYKPGNKEDLLQALLGSFDINVDMERQKTQQLFESELSFEAVGRKVEELLMTSQK